MSESIGVREVRLSPQMSASWVKPIPPLGKNAIVPRKSGLASRFERAEMRSTTKPIRFDTVATSGILRRLSEISKSRSTDREVVANALDAIMDARDGLTLGQIAAKASLDVEDADMQVQELITFGLVEQGRNPRTHRVIYTLADNTSRHQAARALSAKPSSSTRLA